MGLELLSLAPAEPSALLSILKMRKWDLRRLNGLLEASGLKEWNSNKTPHLIMFSSEIESPPLITPITL
jgi:hypothetical protein